MYLCSLSIVIAEAMDSFEWARKLQCPENVCTVPVKARLCKGILELLWSEIGNSSFVNKEVSKVRKNILLYKLKHKLEDVNIECIENVARLKMERKKLKTLSTSLKEEYELEELLFRQKAEQLKNIKSKYSLVKKKKKLLKLKHSESCTELTDHENLSLICKNLMPKTSKDLNEDMLKEGLNAVTTLCLGATKKQVIDKVSNLLFHINVPTLWTHLYQGLCEDINNLIKLKDTTTSENVFIENLDKKCLEADQEDFNVGIARLWVKHICFVSKRLLSEKKANDYQCGVINNIENIETSIGNHIDITEWLCLILEVQKFKAEEEVLQNEIKVIQSECNDNMSIVQYPQLLAEVRGIDSEINKCIENIQHSLMLLKSAEFTILRAKDKLHTEYMGLVRIQAENCNFNWLKDKLSTELNIFYKVLNIEALKKVMLKGNIRSIRHETSMLKEASVLATPLKTFNNMSYFPMVRAPIYYLIDCYKNLITNYTYQRIEASLAGDEDDLPVSVNKYDYNTTELLMLSQRSCDIAQEEIDAFNPIFNDGIHQTVQNIMTLVKKTVDDLTFAEWTNRYSSLLYMIDKC